MYDIDTAAIGKLLALTDDSNVEVDIVQRMEAKRKLRQLLSPEHLAQWLMALPSDPSGGAADPVVVFQLLGASQSPLLWSILADACSAISTGLAVSSSAGSISWPVIFSRSTAAGTMVMPLFVATVVDGVNSEDLAVALSAAAALRSLLLSERQQDGEPKSVHQAGSFIRAAIEEHLLNVNLFRLFDESAPCANRNLSLSTFLTENVPRAVHFICAEFVENLRAGDTLGLANSALIVMILSKAVELPPNVREAFGGILNGAVDATEFAFGCSALATAVFGDEANAKRLREMIVAGVRRLGDQAVLRCSGGESILELMSCAATTSEGCAALHAAVPALLTTLGEVLRFPHHLIKIAGIRVVQSMTSTALQRHQNHPATNVEPSSVPLIDAAFVQGALWPLRTSPEPLLRAALWTTLAECVLRQEAPSAAGNPLLAAVAKSIRPAAASFICGSDESEPAVRAQQLKCAQHLLWEADVAPFHDKLRDVCKAGVYNAAVTHKTEEDR